MESLFETDTIYSEGLRESFDTFKGFQGAFASQIIDGDVFHQFPASGSLIFSSFFNILLLGEIHVFPEAVNVWILNQVNYIAETNRQFALSVRGGITNFNNFTQSRRFCIDFLKEHFDEVTIKTFRDCSDQFVAYLAVFIHLRVMCECKDNYTLEKIFVDLEAPSTIREFYILALLSSAAQHLEVVQETYVQSGSQDYFQSLADCVVRMMGIDGARDLLVLLLGSCMDQNGNDYSSKISLLSNNCFSPLKAANAYFKFLDFKQRALETRNQVTDNEIALSIAHEAGLHTADMVLAIVDVSSILLARLFYPFCEEMNKSIPIDHEPWERVEKHMLSLIIPQGRGTIDYFCEYYRISPDVPNVLRFDLYQNGSATEVVPVYGFGSSAKYYVLKEVNDFPDRFQPGDDLKSSVTLLSPMSGILGFRHPQKVLNILLSLNCLLKSKTEDIPADSPRFVLLESRQNGFDVTQLTKDERVIYDMVVVCEGNVFIYDNASIATRLGYTEKGVLTAMSRINDVIRSPSRRFITVDGIVIWRQVHIDLINMRRTIEPEKLAALPPVHRAIFDIVTIPNYDGFYFQEQHAWSELDRFQRGKLKKIHGELSNTRWIEDVMFVLEKAIRDYSDHLKEQEVLLITYTLKLYHLGVPLRSENNYTIAWQKLSKQLGLSINFGGRMYRRLRKVVEI